MSRKSNGPAADDFNARLATQQLEERKQHQAARETEIISTIAAFMRERARQLVLRAELASATAISQLEKHQPPEPLDDMGLVFQTRTSISLHGVTTPGS